jgi:hypothetical protein
VPEGLLVRRHLEETVQMLAGPARMTEHIAVWGVHLSEAAGRRLGQAALETTDERGQAVRRTWDGAAAAVAWHPSMNRLTFCIFVL